MFREYVVTAVNWIELQWTETFFKKNWEIYLILVYGLVVSS